MNALTKFRTLSLLNLRKYDMRSVSKFEIYPVVLSRDIFETRIFKDIVCTTRINKEKKFKIKFKVLLKFSKECRTIVYYVHLNIRIETMTYNDVINHVFHLLIMHI